MDIAFLVSLLAPCLPFFLKLGNKAAEKAAEKAGEKSVGTAEKLWFKLRPKVEAKEAAKEAAIDVATNPDDKSSRTVLQVQLKKILEADPSLAAEVSQLLKEASESGVGSTQIEVNVSGNDNVGFGQVKDGSKAIGNVQGDVTM